MTIDQEALYNKYNLDINCFEDVDIDYDTLKLRTANCLKSARIYTIAQLLSTNYEKLLSIRNMGMTSLQDIEVYIKNLVGMSKGNVLCLSGKPSVLIIRRSDFIFEGIFSDELYKGLPIRDMNLLDSYKKGYGLLGQELVLQCKNNPEYICNIIKILRFFTRGVDELKHLNKLKGDLTRKLQNYTKPYMEVYANSFDLETKLYDFCMLEDTKISDLFDEKVAFDVPVKARIKFAKWASYDLKKEFNSFMEEVNSRGTSNVEKVLRLRAKKLTLQEIGTELGVTRERVRQIEKKVVVPFCKWQRTRKFLPRLSAEFGGETILEATDIQEYFGDMTEKVLYLLQCADDEYFSYDKQTDTVIIVDDDITDFARDYVEKMPSNIQGSQIDDFRRQALEEYSIPKDIFDREIARQYNRFGAYYHRSKLSLKMMYMTVLRKYYPDGMDVYDERELEKFRQLLLDEFGDVSLPKKNRSISAAIGRCCILCGRGRYRVLDDEKMPHDLIDRVYRYISDSDRTLFFINEIYMEFEQELLDAGIDNRFFLQGLLRKKYDNQLFFRRDYVSKDSNNMSLYRDIKLFIKKSKYPLTKEQIRAAFPGITEIMITLSVADEDIINFFGAYIHSDNLSLYDGDKAYFVDILNRILEDGIPHHCNELYEIMLNDNSDLLNRLGVLYQYSLFSLLQYLFGECYEFERPYIAQRGVSINKPMELMQEYVAANDVFELTELLGIAREYHYIIYDILKFFDEWNKTHLLINKQEMASIEYIGITEDIAHQVEQMVLEEIGDQSLVTQLECVHRFPKVNVPWDEWLIYSVVNRWGTQLEAHTTYKYFRSASPVLSRIGRFNRADYNYMEDAHMTQTVDLNDMDAINDYIMEDLELEW